MSSSIKLKNANGKTVSITNSNANQTDKEVIYLNTVDELANASGSINAVAIVSDLDRGGTFEWSATGTANGGTVFAGVSGYWNRQYSGAVNVKWFGAVGDGVTDDTIAIQNAINLEEVLDFGSYAYKITNTLSLTTTKDLNWKSNGAKILFNPNSAQRSVLSVTCGAFNHIIDGKLYIDANQKAFIGLNVSSTSGADFTANSIEIENVYRSSTAYTGGDGIIFTGYFENIVLNNPIVKNCFMATGAGILGSQGIFGITVTRSDNYEAINVSINNPYIENIYSEDGAYVADQDGIRVFARYAPTIGQSPATFSLNGGYIKNVRGRSVKSQTEQGFVNGLTLIRDTSANDGVASVLAQNADIEMQTGGGSITNIQFQYDDYLPRRIVRFIQANTDTELYKTGFSISDINCIIRGTQILDNIVEITTVANSGNTERTFIGNINNITCDAETAISKFLTIGGDGDANVNVSNIVANINDYFVEFGTSVDTANVRTINTLNINSTIATSSINQNSNRTLTMLNSIGFNQPTLIIEKDGLYDRTNINTNTLGVFYRNSTNSKVHILGNANSTLALGMGTPTDPSQGGLIYAESSKTLILVANGDNQVEAYTNAFRPSSDNTKTLGSSSRRWSVVYAGTGTINTSDEREKTFYSIEQAEIECAKECKALIKKYKFNSSISEKGEDNARIHFGSGAQTIQQCFIKYGLNPENYGIFCYDKWEETSEVKDEEGNIIQEYVPAGDRYGLRYDELAMFILGAL